MRSLPYLTVDPWGQKQALQSECSTDARQGSGIGRATAVAFARAGADKIVLIGRNEAPLVETQKFLECSSSVHAADVTDEKAIAEIATSTGRWDVMILAAGYVGRPAPIRESSVDDLWKNFEVGDSPYRVPQIPEPY